MSVGLHQQLWTTADLAQAAGVNQSRIRQLLIAKKIEGHKLANVWLIPESDALQFLHQRSATLNSGAGEDAD